MCFKSHVHQVWWHTPVVFILRRGGRKGQEVMVSPGYVKLSQNNTRAKSRVCPVPLTSIRSCSSLGSVNLLRQCSELKEALSTGRLEAGTWRRCVWDDLETPYDPLVIFTDAPQVPLIRDLMWGRLSVIRLIAFNSIAGLVLPGGWE